MARIGSATYMKRSAQGLSTAYAFLTSLVCSSYITGTVLPVTGEVGS